MTYLYYELARVIHEDREREIRNRRPRTPGVPSGLRHPRLPERELPSGPAVQPATRPAIAGSR